MIHVSSSIAQKCRQVPGASLTYLFKVAIVNHRRVAYDYPYAVLITIYQPGFHSQKRIENKIQETAASGKMAPQQNINLCLAQYGLGATRMFHQERLPAL